jgi:hypothetical protein
VARDSRQGDGEDPVRRRQLLANLVITAAAAAGPPLVIREAEPVGEAAQGNLLVERVRDAMLGLGPAPALIPPGRLQAGLAAAMADSHALEDVLRQVTAHAATAGTLSHEPASTRRHAAASAACPAVC